MITRKSISLHGRPIAGGTLPAIIAPLVAPTRAAIVEEAAAVAAMSPDVLEWRVDFYEGIGDVHAVVATALAIRAVAGGIPVLLTRRHQREGGNPLAVDEATIVAMYAAACAAQCVELIDYELANTPADVQHLREVSAENGVAMIMSFHDFSCTPDAATLDAKFAEAQRRGADVAKLAVMPASMADVLALLAATERASRRLRIPLISMAMGGLGAVSRVAGWQCGSAASFAVGQHSSAPGQIAIDELRLLIAGLRKAAGV